MSQHTTDGAVSRSRQFPTVRQYMTAGPWTIARSQPLARARHIMHEHQIRHLPVLDGGRVVGLISERDVLMVEALPGVNPTDVRIEEAMTQEVFTAAPETPLGEVVKSMIERRLGSAVVTENDRVVGVFTAVDAMRALFNLLHRDADA